ncbi:MAG: type II toxin-antitoxin system VapC family toxin [Gaiellaceae bacterium]
MTAATSPSSGTSAVVDASAAVRALVYFDEEALAWLDAEVAWPTLVYPEVAHVVLRLHRNGRLTHDRANLTMRTLFAVAAHARPVESLVGSAWPVALDRKISVYDACYVVLAEALDAPLVTADRRLAAATANAVLL